MQIPTLVSHLAIAIPQTDREPTHYAYLAKNQYQGTNIHLNVKSSTEFKSINQSKSESLPAILHCGNRPDERRLSRHTLEREDALGHCQGVHGTDLALVITALLFQLAAPE
jgi:hypothetical protein